MAIPGSFPRPPVPPAMNPVASAPGAPTVPQAPSPVLQQLRSMLGGGTMFPQDPRGHGYGRVFQQPAAWRQMVPPELGQAFQQRGSFQPGSPASFLFGGGLPGPVTGPGPSTAARPAGGWLGYLSGLLGRA